MESTVISDSSSAERICRSSSSRLTEASSALCRRCLAVRPWDVRILQCHPCPLLHDVKWIIYRSSYSPRVASRSFSPKLYLSCSYEASSVVCSIRSSSYCSLSLLFSAICKDTLSQDTRPLRSSNVKGVCCCILICGNTSRSKSRCSLDMLSSACARSSRRRVSREVTCFDNLQFSASKSSPLFLTLFSRREIELSSLAFSASHWAYDRNKLSSTV